jgi:hypothetical protein
MSLPNVFHNCTNISAFSLLWVQQCNRTGSDSLNKHDKTIEKIGALRFITTENVGLPSHEKMSWFLLRLVSLSSCCILLYSKIQQEFLYIRFRLRLVSFFLAESCCILLYVRFRLRSLSVVSCCILMCIAVYCCILVFGCVRYLYFLAESCCILLYIAVYSHSFAFGFFVFLLNLVV